MRPIPIASIICGLLLLPLLVSWQSDPADAAPKANRYIGSKACKDCHSNADKGDQYGHWAKNPHAHAYENLGKPAAKAVAAKLGIKDPQKSEQCLKCHVTAFGVDDKLIKKSFKVEEGVQCETCHGPGEDHRKKRLKEKMKAGSTPSPVTAEEINNERSAALCKQCHNPQSPTYKPFCLKERMKAIEHLDPSKERSDAELAKLRATCTEDCKVCDEQKKDGEAKPDGGK